MEGPYNLQGIFGYGGILVYNVQIVHSTYLLSYLLLTALRLPQYNQGGGLLPPFNTSDTLVTGITYGLNIPSSENDYIMEDLMGFKMFKPEAYTGLRIFVNFFSFYLFSLFENHRGDLILDMVGIITNSFSFITPSRPIPPPFYLLHIQNRKKLSLGNFDVFMIR